MMLSEVFERFVEEAPVCVMMRATLEQVFAPTQLDALFAETAVRQYTRELLFSSVVDLMSLVVCRVHPSVHAAYVRRRQEVGVSVRALYDKLNHIEPAVGRSLARHTARQAGDLIRELGGAHPPPLPGYRCRILDGNHLGGTEHRLAVLRGTGAGALPGQVLAVLDPEAMVLEDVFPCPDGHAQECTLLEPVLETVRPRDVWIDDRGFCTSSFLFGLARRRAFFVTRQHAGHLVWRKQGRRRRVGRCATGRVYEQGVVLTDPATGEQLPARRVTVRLDHPTRDGDAEIHILTNVPAEDADAVAVAELYRGRWTLETAFQELTVYLKCEPNTLGYPPAALFAFCVAVACNNLLAVVKAALRAAHGDRRVREDVSNYFLADEVSGTYRGMMIALPPEQWRPFQTLTAADLAKLLCQWAHGIDLTAYPKHARGPKKPVERRPPAGRQHVATARLLRNERPQLSQ
jgi:hypothetical protein